MKVIRAFEVFMLSTAFKILIKPFCIVLTNINVFFLSASESFWYQLFMLCRNIFHINGKMEPGVMYEVSEKVSCNWQKYKVKKIFS